jgi:phosphoribosylformylglycinamidine synthase
VYRQYDQQVGTNSLILPGSDAGVLRIKGTTKAIALTTDGNARFVYVEPRLGAALAVAEAARNIAVAGGRALGLTDCLNFGSPERPEILWQFKEAVAGIGEACRALDIPVVGGNVSFYNETTGQAILPTPVIGMAGLLDDADARCAQWFEIGDDRIALIGPDQVSLGGSEYLWVLQRRVAGRLAPLDFGLERAAQDACRAAIGAGLLRSAHDCAEGGIAVALAEACASGPSPIGADVDLGFDGLAVLSLFGEGPSRILVSVRAPATRHFEQLMGEYAVPWRWLGRVGGDRLVVRNRETLLIDLSLQRIAQSWRTGFERYVG